MVQGTATALTWSSAQAISCTASQDPVGEWAGTQPTSGTLSLSPPATTVYTLTCTGASGTTPVAKTATVTVTAPPAPAPTPPTPPTPPAPTITLAAGAAGVVTGGTTTLTWSSTNATACSATGGWTGVQPTSGTATTPAATATQTYGLTCTGPGGTGTASVQVSLTNAASFAVTPRSSALTLTQSQQFGAAVPGGGAAAWSVDGVSGGSAALGTISSSGVYLPPAVPGTHTILATSIADPTQGGSATVAVTDLDGVYTFHNDTARTGQNLHEYALTPASLTSGGFGKRWSCAVDGDVFAQPLYVANLSIGGGVHNVLFIVTQNNSVYAFDADDSTCKSYWTFSAMPAGAHPVSYTDLGGCNDIATIGITGSPVIDPATKTMYFVTKTKETAGYFQRLHALNLATGVETHAPTDITATVPGTGSGGTTVTFSPKWQNQRPGLSFYQGAVFIGWSAHCDAQTWWGWLMKYDGASLAQQGILNIAPNGAAGGIWMSGGAPAVDSSGHLFLSTGNGSFSDRGNVLPASQPNNNFSMSFLNISPATLAVQDFYTPSQEAIWSGADADISSGGVLVLPDGVGGTAHPNLLVGADKQSHLWLLDRSALGQFNAGGDTNAVQYLTLPGATVCDGNCVLSSPAYYNQTLYIAPAMNPLMAIKLSQGVFNQMSGTALTASVSADTYGYPGATPVISAAPSGGGIVWALDNSNYANRTDTGLSPGGPAILHAYDASDLSINLYSSTLTADRTGGAVKFTVPVVANGHVYVAGTADPGNHNPAQVTVYGLAP